MLPCPCLPACMPDLLWLAARSCRLPCCCLRAFLWRVTLQWAAVREPGLVKHCLTAWYLPVGMYYAGKVTNVPHKLWGFAHLARLQ